MSSNGGCEINEINKVNDGSGQSIDKPRVLLDERSKQKKMETKSYLIVVVGYPL
jgi:hypothetical protein